MHWLQVFFKDAILERILVVETFDLFKILENPRHHGTETQRAHRIKLVLIILRS